MAKRTKMTTKKKAERKTVSSEARRLILAGRTNEQVFAALRKQFKLPDSKRSYPTWYRAQLVRIERATNGARAADALRARLAATR